MVRCVSSRSRPRSAWRLALVAVLSATAVARPHEASADVAGSDREAPAYTLTVDSDANDEVSYATLAPLIQRELGAEIARAEVAPAPTRAAIVVRYRKADRKLTVRATHPEGRVLERTVDAPDDAASARSAAVLLAGNLARDEARELLDELAARRPKPAPEPVAADDALVPPAPGPALPDDGRLPVNVALAYPVATNGGRPAVRTNVDVSLFYGRVGSVRGVGIGAGLVRTGRSVSGAQIGALGTWNEGTVDGFTLAAVGNVGLGVVRAVQLSAGFNVAGRALVGAQITAGVNVAERAYGVQIGLVNVARHVRGTQIGLVNVAEDSNAGQVGIFSISRHGLHPTAWLGSLNHLNVGVRFAGPSTTKPHVYTVTAFSLGTLEGSFASPGFTIAVGGHLPVTGKLDVDLETATSMMFGFEGRSAGTQNSAAHLRVLPGYAFSERLRVFAGGGVRLPYAFDVGGLEARPELMAGVSF